jgi:hypothetical protein
MIDLHVYPPCNHQKLRSPPGERHLICGASTMGHRAKMVYIHGTPDKWDEPRAQQWLAELVMTRLVDDNPARVVWNA